MNPTAIGAFLVALAIGLGAFGAHALSALPPNEARYWATGAQYHFIGAFGVVAFGLLQRARGGPWGPAWLLIAGIAVFSGSLYAMALGAPRAFGAITPIGGICLILGWIWLGIAAARERSR